MRLQNGYKIIYEKSVDGKNHLFASKNSIPSEDDVEVKFDSLTEDQVKAFKFIYEADEGFKGTEDRLPGEADKSFALTDGSATILAGDHYELSGTVEEPEAAEEPVVRKTTKRTPKVAEQTETEEPAEMAE